MKKGQNSVVLVGYFISEFFLGNFAALVGIGVYWVINNILNFYWIFKIKFRPPRPSFMQISLNFCTNWVRLVRRVVNFSTLVGHIVRHYLSYNWPKNLTNPTKCRPPTDSYSVTRMQKGTYTPIPTSAAKFQNFAEMKHPMYLPGEKCPLSKVDNIVSP